MKSALIVWGGWQGHEPQQGTALFAPFLEEQGYEVVSTDRLESTLEQCKLGGFDLFILGHSIPQEDKQKMVEAFRQHCSALIISLRRHPAEGIVDTADYHIDPDPKPLLEFITDLVRQKAG